MAISLSKEKKTNFLSFLEEIIKGDPLECAKWIYKVSMREDRYLRENSDQDQNPYEMQSYFNDLNTMFEGVHKTALESLQGLEVLSEMLRVVRNHNVKLDG